MTRVSYADLEPGDLLESGQLVLAVVRHDVPGSGRRSLPGVVIQVMLESALGSVVHRFAAAELRVTLDTRVALGSLFPNEILTEWMTS